MKPTWPVAGAIAIAGILGSEAWAGTEVFGKSMRVDYGRLAVYRLEGTAREIGEAVGMLIPRGSIPGGMTVFMSSFVEGAVFQAPAVRNRPWLRKLVRPFLALKYHRPLGRQILADEREYFEGFRKATGLEASLLRRAFLNPDVAHVMVADYMLGKLFPISTHPHAGGDGLDASSPFGCSTFIVPPEDSADGRMLFARAQDYPGVGVFDAYPSVHFIAKPGAYKYVEVTTAGIAVGGITAMNEHGLTLSLHSAMSLNADGRRTPVLSTTGRMMESARTIEEAVAVCNAFVPMSAWIMNLADVKNGAPRAARVEVNPRERRCDVDFQPRFLVSTNHYFREENRKSEIRGGPSFAENTRDRFDRITGLLGAFGRKITLEDAARILADRYDPRLRRQMSYAPAGVAALHQVAAVLFKPETREFWVSDGSAPPASRGTYVHFSFADFDRLEAFPQRSRDLDVNIARALAGTPNDISRLPALLEYQAAYTLFDRNGTANPGESWAHVDAAVRLEPAEPIYRLARGLLSLALSRAEEGIHDLASVQEDPGLDPHRRRVARFFRATGLDVIGRRAEALALYSGLVRDEATYPALREIARERLDAPAAAGVLRNIAPDLRFADTISYD